MPLEAKPPRITPEQRLKRDKALARYKRRQAREERRRQRQEEKERRAAAAAAASATAATHTGSSGESPQNGGADAIDRLSDTATMTTETTATHTVTSTRASSGAVYGHGDYLSRRSQSHHFFDEMGSFFSSHHHRRPSHLRGAPSECGSEGSTTSRASLASSVRAYFQKKRKQQQQQRRRRHGRRGVGADEDGNSENLDVFNQFAESSSDASSGEENMGRADEISEPPGVSVGKNSVNGSPRSPSSPLPLSSSSSPHYVLKASVLPSADSGSGESADAEAHAAVRRWATSPVHLSPELAPVSPLAFDTLQQRRKTTTMTATEDTASRRVADTSAPVVHKEAKPTAGVKEEKEEREHGVVSPPPPELTPRRTTSAVTTTTEKAEGRRRKMMTGRDVEQNVALSGFFASSPNVAHSPHSALPTTTSQRPPTASAKPITTTPRGTAQADGAVMLSEKTLPRNASTASHSPVSHQDPTDFPKYARRS